MGPDVRGAFGSLLRGKRTAVVPTAGLAIRDDPCPHHGEKCLTAGGRLQVALGSNGQAQGDPRDDPLPARERPESPGAPSLLALCLRRSRHPSERPAGLLGALSLVAHTLNGGKGIEGGVVSDGEETQGAAGRPEERNDESGTGSHGCVGIWEVFSL